MADWNDGLRHVPDRGHNVEHSKGPGVWPGETWAAGKLLPCTVCGKPVLGFGTLCFDHNPEQQARYALIDAARSLARKAHAGQTRRNGDDFYTAHVARVAQEVNHHTNDPVTIAAAYLHDVPEDCGLQWRDEIGKLNPEVLSIVDALTEPGAGVSPKASWEVRKTGYLASIATMDERALLISMCDKIITGYDFINEWRRGEGDRKERTHRFYQQLATAYASRCKELAVNSKLNIVLAYFQTFNEWLQSEAQRESHEVYQ